MHYRGENDLLRLIDWWPDGLPGWLDALVQTTTRTIDLTAMMAAAAEGRGRRRHGSAALLVVP